MVKGWEARNRRSAPWSQTEKERLLARHLYTVTELNKAPVKPYVDEVIRVVTSRLKSRRSQGQVKRKLAACLKEYSLQGQPLDLDTFYLQGSRILTNIPNNVANNIDFEYLVIQEKELETLTNSKRSSRSARRLQDTKGKNYKSISRSCTPMTPTRRQQRSQLGDILPAIKVEPSTRRAPPTEAASQEQNISTSQPPTPSRPVDSSQLLGVYINREHTSIVQQAHDPVLGGQNSFWASSSSAETVIHYDKDWSDEHIDVTLSRGQITVYDLFRDNAVLRGRVSVLENDVAEHQRDQRVQNSIPSNHQRDEEIKKLRQALNETDMELSLYRQRDHSRERYESSLDSNSSSVRQQMESNIRSLSDQLAYAMDNLMKSGIVVKDILSGDFLNSPDLLPLANRAFGGRQLHAALSMLPNSNATILQSLVGASVCEWVFLERTQWIATISSPLLESWKRQAAAIWGRDAAFAVDSLAHRSLFGKGEFGSDRMLSVWNDYHNGYVFQSTKNLADRFSTIIKPLLSLSASTSALTGILRSIFYYALEMKMAAVTRGYRVDVIWPAHGCDLSSTRMIEYHQSQSSVRRNCEGQNQNVLVSLLPGLRVRLGKQRAFVDYHGLDLDEDTIPDAADVIVPARVIAI